MARDGVTFEQIEAVAEALTGEGLAPTIRAVRERLGNTGSPNTIQRHLVRWRELRPSAPVPPPNIPDGILSAIAQEIERAAIRARAETEARLELAQAELAELATVGETLEVEREALGAQAGELARERDTLAGKAAEQAQEIERQARDIERERQAAEAARIEIAQGRLRSEAQAEKLAEQAAEIQRLRDALEASQRASQQAGQDAAVLAAKLEASERRATEIEAREQAAQARAAEAERQGQAAARELVDARIREQACQARLEGAARELEVLRGKTPEVGERTKAKPQAGKARNLDIIEDS